MLLLMFEGGGGAVVIEPPPSQEVASVDTNRRSVNTGGSSESGSYAAGIPYSFREMFVNKVKPEDNHTLPLMLAFLSLVDANEDS